VFTGAFGATEDRYIMQLCPFINATQFPAAYIEAQRNSSAAVPSTKLAELAGQVHLLGVFEGWAQKPVGGSKSKTPKAKLKAKVKAAPKKKKYRYDDEDDEDNGSADEDDDGDDDQEDEEQDDSDHAASTADDPDGMCRPHCEQPVQGLDYVIYGVVVMVAEHLPHV